MSSAVICGSSSPVITRFCWPNTVAGTTGARASLSPALAPLVERTRRLTDVPLYAGFGISTPEQAAAAADLADGVVVGSAALVAAENGVAALESFVAQLRSALA